MDYGNYYLQAVYAWTTVIITYRYSLRMDYSDYYR